MELSTCSEYIKRTQMDYTMTFKIHVVSEIEQGILTKSEAKKRYGVQGSGTISKWLEEFGSFDRENKDPLAMPKSKDKRILELEQKIRLLEKENATLKHQSN